MLIQFSDDIPEPELAVEQCASTWPIADIKWCRGNEVRFTLPGATVAQHEQVILALLTLDPRATIRTARARYAGLADYQRQLAGKKSGLFTY